MPAGRYLFIPFLRTKSQIASDEKLVERKIALKKTDRTNIIATNFVWEQLNISNPSPLPHPLSTRLLPPYITRNYVKNETSRRGGGCENFIHTENTTNY